MKLEFNRTEHSHFELVQDTIFSREETLEMIVPDACPDIVQITDTCGFCCLTRREMTDSGALLAGTILVTVFYVPEGNGGLRRLEAKLPFQHLSECAQGSSTCRLLASAAVMTAETRIMNPRKIMLRVDLRETVQIYRPAALGVCGSLIAPPELGVQQRIGQYQTDLTLEPSERLFSMEETLTLPAGKSPAAALLRLQPTASCAEAKLIGTKLVLKGSVRLELLVQSENGELSAAVFELPVSQMLEAGIAGETVRFQAQLQVLDWQLGPLSGDGRAVSITLELAAQAVFYAPVPVALVNDAYSIRCPLTVQREVLNLPRLSDCAVLRQPVRAAIETEESVQDICWVHGALGLHQLSREGDLSVLTIPVSAAVLFRTEQGQYSARQAGFSVTIQRSLPDPGKLSCAYELIQMEALPAATGIELRGIVEVRLAFRQFLSAEYLAQAELDEEHPLDRAGQPSVVLRRPGAGEDLWAIARRYAATEDEIRRANELLQDQLSADQMLLIPRKR